MTKTILLIEDEPDVALVAKTRLESAGYEVVVAPTAEEGFLSLKNNIPDLILLDLLLPKMQGQEMCEKLKTDSKLKAIAVMLFTATASDVPTLVKNLKANDYIRKPYSPEELLGKIKNLIG